MSRRILFIARADVAYRELLLESQGYSVTRVDEIVAEELTNSDFGLALVGIERGVEATIRTCRALKSQNPELCVAVLAQRGDYLPHDTCIDAVIYEEYSPGEFIAQVRQLLERQMSRGKGESA